MQEIRRFFSRLVTLFRAGKADSDLTREIDAHLQLLQDQFVAKGMAPEEARYAAKRAFGGVEQVKERQRDSRTFAWLTGFSIDLKLGVRMIRKWPGLTVIAVFALAVGIGAGAGYFETINDMLRPKLSFPGAERVVGLLNWNLAKGDVEDRSLYEFAAWKTQLTTVEELGAAQQSEDNLFGDDGRVRPASGWEISASAFRVVPIPPLYGRPLLDDDEKPGAEPVIVLGEDIWKAHFNSDPQVIGRRVQVGETLRTVVGVIPNGLGLRISHWFWTPLRLNPSAVKRGEGPRIRMFGRLAPGADLNRAQAELETVARRMDEGRAGAAGTRVSIHPLAESFIVAFSRSSVNRLFLMVYSTNILFIALLGICAANVAHLVFARAITRESEITVRTALGASRWRIVGQFVAEALVLASIAAVVGLAAANFAQSKVMEMMVGGTLPLFWNERLSIDTIAYTALLVIIAALLTGGLPALKATGPHMNARLKEASAGGSTLRFGKLWTGVVVTQVALTVILLLLVVTSASAVYLRSTGSAEVAFPRNQYLVGQISFEGEATPERDNAVRRELQRRLNSEPSVINATFTGRLPGTLDMDEFWIELSSTGEDRGKPLAIYNPMFAGSNYFETFQQQLVAGRSFTASEIEETRHVAIVDETFVRLVLGGQSALGRLVRESRNERSDQPGPWLEIVGVVKDITLTPNKTIADAMLYQPEGWRGRKVFVLHSRNKEAAASRLRDIVAATDPQVHISGLMTIGQRVQSDARSSGYIITAIGIVAAVILMLAAAGIHSLISFTLASRTREIGIRTALGAAPRRIITGMLSPTFLKVAIGIVLGSIPGIAFVWQTMDFGISYRSVVIAGVCVALFIIAVAVISSIWPIRRTLKIHPTEALRTT